MTLSQLAGLVVDAAEGQGVEFMIVGALAAGFYGVPRSTKDVDFLMAFSDQTVLPKLTNSLVTHLEFDPQVVFDTLTWGRRHIGRTLEAPSLKVELFELFDDPFVQEEFRRKIRVFVPLLERTTWLPTAEDVIVQKIRWGRSKDLDDARDVLAVQGTETLDMAYIRYWCAQHKTSARLDGILESIPPL